MTPSLYVSIAIMALFVLASMIWSLTRIRSAHGIWRIVHAALVVLMIAAITCVYLNLATYGMLTGIALLLLSLAVAFMDKSRMRWLAFIPLFSGILLAAGIPFVSG